MPAQIQFESDGTCVLRGSGTLKQSEFAGIQKQIATKIEQGAKPRLLAILENFEGWERGVDWNDLDFLMAYSDAIKKIAIVGQPEWRHMLSRLPEPASGARRSNSFLRSKWRKRESGSRNKPIIVRADSFELDRTEI
jgi:hypothetical protein